MELSLFSKYLVVPQVLEVFYEFLRIQPFLLPLSHEPANFPYLSHTNPVHTPQSGLF
jgi:hypothetical protein